MNESDKKEKQQPDYQEQKLPHLIFRRVMSSLSEHGDRLSKRTLTSIPGLTEHSEAMELSLLLHSSSLGVKNLGLELTCK